MGGKKLQISTKKNCSRIFAHSWCVVKKVNTENKHTA